MSRPFFVVGTPRSRTAWLAAFLSTSGRPCLHEPSRLLATRVELLEMLRAPAAAISDSGLTLRWRDIKDQSPDARVVVVRRPVEGVMASLAILGLNSPAARRAVVAIDAEISSLIGSMRAMVVPYRELQAQLTCEQVYEFCLGVVPPAGHWAEWARRNVQANVRSRIEDVQANASGIAEVFPELVAAG